MARTSPPGPLGPGWFSLADGVPPAEVGTLFVSSIFGGYRLPPRPGFGLVFGRNTDDANVGVGVGDLAVSRRQGVLDWHDGHWWLRNTGRRTIRLSQSRMLFPAGAGDEPESVPLGDDYTVIYVRGSQDREHLLEVFVVGPDGGQARPRPHDETATPRRWPLDDDERLVLVALARRYLYQELHPQPLSRQQIADALNELSTEPAWTYRRVEHHITRVRLRLSAAGVAGLTEDEVGRPVGNALNVNLISELLRSTTLVPPDLALIEPGGGL